MRAALCMLMVLLALPVAVSAQTFDPGIITPEHGILYSLDILFDDLKIFLSPDKQSAVLSVLNERIAEIEMSNGSLPALIDYQMKLKELEKEVKTSPQSVSLDIDVYLAQHKEILSKVEEKVPLVAKPVIESVLNETEKVMSDEEHEITHVGKESLNVERTGSKITVPTEVKVGQSVNVYVKIYNPFNEPISPVVYIEARKEGVVGWIAKKNYLYKLDTEIGPGQTYERTFTVEVPEEFMGIPLEGSWIVKVKVMANGKTLIDEEFEVTVTK